jgi:hypothetical protein
MRNRLALVASAMLIVGLLAGLTTSASAGAGDPGATAAKKKKKKKCPAGTHKVTVKKKNGKRKKKCVADAIAPTPPMPPTTLAISPASFTYPDTEHNDTSAPHAFTITNTSGSTSNVPQASITGVKNPIPGDPPGFELSSNTCAASLAPGGTCTVSVVFKPTSNANPQPYTAVLRATSPSGGDAQAALTGIGT